MSVRRHLLASPLCLALAICSMMAFLPSTGAAAPMNVTAAGAHAFAPDLATDANGDTHATWIRYDGSHFVVQYTRIGLDGSAGTIRSLSAPGQNSADPQIAVDARGNVHVVWAQSDGSNDIIRYTRIGADGTIGSGAADTIIADSGPDIVRALGGNDTINSRDGARDIVDCGPGIDRVRADRIDVLRGCERRF